jgi:F0F1-type ATP synthase membrane subunit c/vacuolar-type H+-ATPase subunit K
MSLGLDESKAEDVERETEVDGNYRTLRIIWLAILASLIIIFIVTRIVTPTPVAPRVLFWILLAVGAGNFGASFFLKQKMLKQAAEKRKPEMLRSAYLIALALCESIGIFGLLAHLITGVEQYYFFFVLSGFGILLHKPQRDDLLAVYAGGGIWEARKND